MVGETLNTYDIIQPEQLAANISNKFDEWYSYRSKWLEEKKELVSYLYATKTDTTTAGQATPWKNNTTIPKITQIYDNLKANYMHNLFPNSNWLDWKGMDADAETMEKRSAILNYMKNKTKMSNFELDVEQLVDDYIIYGNCFAMVSYVSNKTTLPDTEEEIYGYVGPQMNRISPYDIVFNPTAPSFDKAPKIIRTVSTLGDLKREIEDNPEAGYLEDVFNKSIRTRHQVTSYIMGDAAKGEQFEKDGFGGILEYYKEGTVERLDFYGDLYDLETGEFYKNRQITVIDRSYIIRNEPIPSWLGEAPIRHAGWRKRPDNLYAMGPLDNLVGMQFMIDKLYNAKADIFDQIIHPIMVVKGYVEEFEHGPGAKIYCDQDGDVQYLRPDATSLNADVQIAQLEQKMEEMAGAPKQAMGFRSPGEKTKFEVQLLDQATNRIFLNKTAYFERQLLEPILNDMLEIGRRLMTQAEVIRIEDDQYGAILFETLTEEDITAKGKLYPMGARYIAEQANKLQELLQLFNVTSANPVTAPHMRGLEVGKLLYSLAGYDSDKLFSENAYIYEQAETQRAQMTAQQVMEEEMLTPTPDPFAEAELAGPDEPGGIF